MLLVIYNSNPSNKPDLPTSKGWSLYTQEDWARICQRVDDYFYYLPEGDTELSFGLTAYYSYEEWLADYQVSELSPQQTTKYVYERECDVLNNFLGTNFYIPEIVQDIYDEPIYPEMDAYA